MQISINLLPQKDKEHIRRTLRTRTILLYGVVLCVMMGIIMAFFALLRFASHIEYSGLIQADAAVRLQSDFQVLEKNDVLMKAANKAVIVAENVDKKAANPSHIIRTIAALMPEKTQITEIVLEGDILSLSGIAHRRDSVLLLRQNMEKSDCLTEIDVPLSSFVTPEDALFTATSIVKSECL